jgi:preprotein translocase subunit YajC
MGTMILAANAATKSGGSPAFTFIILAVLVGLFYVLIMRPQRNRQRKAMATQSQVMPGQRVRTTAGMYGTVVSGDDRDVVLEIAPGVEVTMLRRAIMDVVSDDAMPSHEDIVTDEAHDHEPEAEAEEASEDASPEDGWDLKKDRN